MQGLLHLWALLVLISTTKASEYEFVGQICDSSHNSTDTFGVPHNHVCSKCIFPNDCLLNNTCRSTSAGAMCERCVEQGEVALDPLGVPLDHKGYRRIGSACVRCDMVPWGAVALGVILIIVLILSFWKGFSISLCTKVRLLAHFLQLMTMSLSLRVHWPPVISQYLQYVTFAYMNTAAINLECYINFQFGNHYLEVLSSLGLPLGSLIVLGLVDKTMNKTIQLTKNPKGKQGVWNSRSQLRRIGFLLIVIWYGPMVSSTIRTFACSDTVPVDMVFDHTRNIFLFDQRQTCSSPMFQAFNFISVVYLVGYGIILPLGIIFFTLRLRKWNLLKKHLPLHGCMYETYTRRCVAWEAMPMLRKLIYAIVTDCIPVLPLIQVCVHLGWSVIYILLVLICRPYSKVSWQSEKSIVNIHIFFDIVSNVCVVLLQTHALLSLLHVHHIALDLSVLVVTCVVLALWIMIISSVSMEHSTQADLEVSELPEEQARKEEEQLELWMRNNDGEGISLVQIKKRKDNVDF